MNTKKDYISICIITRNEEKYIIQTLKGVCNQSYGKQNYEVIIVDGDSSDNTVQSADEYLTQQGVTHKIINERKYENKWGGVAYGQTFGRNVSIDVASERSKYIARIDADCRADEYWLENLRKKIKIAETDSKIAGAGGPRYVETKGDISKFELMLNYYFCSYIMTLGNPAFCEVKGLKYIPSIAGYNSIYKSEILRKYMYNTAYPDVFDDGEINYRLTRDGYKFLYCPEAKIYHRLEENISQFLKHMGDYGKGAARMLKYHHAIKMYACMSVGYLLYTIALIPLLFLSWMFIIPYGLVLILATCVFIENILKTKSLVSLWVYLLVFSHPFMYGLGFIRELFKK